MSAYKGKTALEKAKKQTAKRNTIRRKVVDSEVEGRNWTEVKLLSNRCSGTAPAERSKNNQEPTLLRLEEQYRAVSDVEIDEMLRLCSVCQRVLS